MWENRLPWQIESAVLPKPQKRKAHQDVTNTHDDSGGSIQFQASGSIDFNAKLKFHYPHHSVDMDESVKVPKAIEYSRLNDIITSKKQ